MGISRSFYSTKELNSLKARIFTFLSAKLINDSSTVVSVLDPFSGLLLFLFELLESMMCALSVFACSIIVGTELLFPDEEGVISKYSISYSSRYTL